MVGVAAVPPSHSSSHNPNVYNCATDDGIIRCASIVKQGGVIVFPTDTVYGIGCSPFIDSAVDRVYKIKGRQDDKPLPVLSSSIDYVEKLVDLSAEGRILAEKFWPGALTLVANIAKNREENNHNNDASSAPSGNNNISKRVLAGRNSLAVRVPANKCLLNLLSLCGHYLIGTSANPSGKPSPKTAQEVMVASLEGYDALLVDNLHQDSTKIFGIESTIVDVTVTPPKIIRHGALGLKEIEKVLNEKNV